MAVLKTQARPYVRSAADLAHKSGRWEDWGRALGVMGVLASSPAFLKALKRWAPEAQVKDLVLKVTGDLIWEEPLELILVLRDQKQLEIMGEFPELWREMEEERLGTRVLELSLPYTLVDTELSALTAYLETKFHCRLHPRTGIDPLLLGGYTARVGDRVWDATVLGALEKLQDNLWYREIEDATQRQ